jgi:hypothetical protein
VTSALANILMCIAVVAEATFLDFILLLAIIVIGLVIQWKKTRELQEWLRKCYFGAEEKEKQYSETDEHKQFVLLTS